MWESRLPGAGACLMARRTTPPSEQLESPVAGIVTVVSVGLGFVMMLDRGLVGATLYYFDGGGLTCL